MSLSGFVEQEKIYYGPVSTASGTTSNTVLEDQIPRNNSASVNCVKLTVVSQTDSEDVAGTGDLKSWVDEFLVAINTRAGTWTEDQEVPLPGGGTQTIQIQKSGIRSEVQSVSQHAQSAFDLGDLTYAIAPTVTINQSVPLTVNVTCPVYVGGKGLTSKFLIEVLC